MKIYTITAVLCFATTALATQGSSNNIREQRQNELERRSEYPEGVQRLENQLHKRHNEHGVEAHKDGRKHSNKNNAGDNEEDNKESKGEGNKSKSGEGNSADGKAPDGTGAGAGSDAKQGGKEGAAPADGKNPAAGAPVAGKNPVAGAPVGGAPAAGSPASPATDLNIPHDYASPLWLVQPFGASIWEQGRAYVISWGPNPDPIYAKKLADKSPIDIRLMQGPPEQLTEIALLKKDADSSLNSFQWTVPTTVTPATDYSIRLTHEGQVDTYSHYFEIVLAGDPRSSKSNVGEPLELPKKSDLPETKTKPAAPPNPFPADKSASPPAAAKPTAHVSAAVGVQSANMLAFAMTLFGAVYLL